MTDYTIQAEDMTLDGYKVEKVSLADGSELIRLKSSEGTATSTFDGDAGYYDLALSYVDESDGQGSIDVFVNGVHIGTIELTADVDGTGTRRSMTFSNESVAQLVLEPGDVITLQGTKDGGEFARIDSMTLTLMDDPVAVDDSLRVDEDTPGSVNILVNDVDPGTSGLSIVDVAGYSVGVSFAVTTEGGRSGTIVVEADGTLTFTPGADFADMIDGDTDSVQLTYTVTNGVAQSTAVVNVIIDGKGSAIDAVDDSMTVMESEGAGDYETLDGAATSITDNDTANGAPYEGAVIAVNGAVANIGSWIDLGKGRVKVDADGKVDFDAAGDFDDLNSGESAEVSFAYTILAQGQTSSQLEYSFSDPTTGVDAKATVAEVDGKLVISVSVVEDGGQIGDIRGLFFGVADETLLGGLSITGTDVTDSEVNANNVNDLDNGANVGGLGIGFDWGAEIGTQGQSGDDIRQTTIILSHATLDLTLDFLANQDAALRLTSVGFQDGAREESLKLFGTALPTTGDTISDVALVRITVLGEGEPPIVAVNDFITVVETEGAGDVEAIFDLADHSDVSVTNILANDDDNGVAPDSVAKVIIDGAEGTTDTWFDLADGGRVKVSASGEVDFDAAGDFDVLNSGETDTVTFDYTIQRTGPETTQTDTATVTVTIEGVDGNNAVYALKGNIATDAPAPSQTITFIIDHSFDMFRRLPTETQVDASGDPMDADGKPNQRLIDAVLIQIAEAVANLAPEQELFFVIAEGVENPDTTALDTLTLTAGEIQTALAANDLPSVFAAAFNRADGTELNTEADLYDPKAVSFADALATAKGLITGSAADGGTGQGADVDNIVIITATDGNATGPIFYEDILEIATPPKDTPGDLDGIAAELAAMGAEIDVITINTDITLDTFAADFVEVAYPGLVADAAIIDPYETFDPLTLVRLDSDGVVNNATDTDDFGLVELLTPGTVLPSAEIISVSVAGVEYLVGAGEGQIQDISTADGFQFELIDLFESPEAGVFVNVDTDGDMSTAELQIDVTASLMPMDPEGTVFEFNLDLV